MKTAPKKCCAHPKAGQNTQKIQVRRIIFFQEKKHGSGESDQKKVMVKVGNKTKHTGGTGGKKSVASANLVREAFFNDVTYLR